MKKTLFQKVICFILSATLLLSVVCVSAFAASDEGGSLKRDPNGNEKNPYSASTLEDMKTLVGTLSYADYLHSHSENREKYLDRLAATDANPLVEITPTGGITNFDTDDATGNNEGKYAQVVADSALCQTSQVKYQDLWANFGDNASSSVYLPAQGYATWSFDIPEEQRGFYYIKIEYYSVKTDESSVSTIERKLKIDDRIPFSEVSSVKFNKEWVYNYTTTTTEQVSLDTPDSYDIVYKLVEKSDKEGYYKVTTTAVGRKDTVEEIPAEKTGEEGYYKIVTGVAKLNETDTFKTKTVTSYKITQDINGNSMAPEAQAIPTWNTYYISDSTGYYDGYLEFFFEQGTRRFTLEAEREPLVIKSITLVPVKEPVTVTEESGIIKVHQQELPTYAEILQQYKDMGYYKVAEGGQIVRIEAEFPDIVSDSSVASTNDNTSAINYPISASSQLYNVIGENSYNAIGQWAAYKFTVTKTGLYNLAMRYKQDALQGMFICRTIKIHGGQYGEADGTPEVPFAEAYQAEFNYSKEWQSTYVGKDDEAFMFFFEEGVEYTVYFECSLGTLKDYIQRVEVSLDKINSYYLQILQLTGTDPDENRDYNFMGIMPEAIWGLLEEAIELYDVKQGLEELCGTNGSHIATLEPIYTLLDTMGSDSGLDVAANMTTFKSYLGTLGTWINNSKASRMIVDSIWVVPAVADGADVVADASSLPRAEAGFFKSVWFEIKAFFSSFFVDYDQMGLTTEPDENTLNIDVWLASGRDQSQIWRTMIDAEGSFTYSTGTAVSLKLVTGGTLLPSILSRKGPDVYLGLGAADVINYAIRDAVLGVSGNIDPNYTSLSDEKVAAANAIFSKDIYSYRNEDGSVTTTTEPIEGRDPSFVSYNFKDAVNGNFAQAAMDTLTLRGVSYGIPQTMGFAMMFYRMDVLADLELEVPETWQELLSILPVLQTNNMSIGVSYIDALDFMIYQRGGSMWKYTDSSKYDPEYAGARVDLDSDIALETFDFTCRLYSDYSFPVSYDASNRFRTGEMPIIIGGYSGIYNTLTVYATEIEGLWEFCSLPGSERADGTFNYDSLAGVSASVILHGCEGEELRAAWQFLQWQTGEDAQANYGNRMVALIGPSAKYDTANLKAIDNLSWTAREKQAILNQMDHLSSIVNYPGSYIINRYTQFAFLDAVNESADPIDALSGYIDAINSEIARKRDEFGIWIPKDADDEPPMLGEQ